MRRVRARFPPILAPLVCFGALSAGAAGLMVRFAFNLARGFLAGNCAAFLCVAAFERQSWAFFFALLFAWAFDDMGRA
jgi:hypothetical protein